MREIVSVFTDIFSVYFLRLCIHDGESLNVCMDRTVFIAPHYLYFVENYQTRMAVLRSDPHPNLFPASARWKKALNISLDLVFWFFGRAFSAI